MLRIVSKKESAANLFAAAPFASRMDFPVRVSLANSPRRGPKIFALPGKMVRTENLRRLRAETFRRKAGCHRPSSGDRRGYLESAGSRSEGPRERCKLRPVGGGLFLPLANVGGPFLWCVRGAGNHRTKNRAFRVRAAEFGIETMTAGS